MTRPQWAKEGYNDDQSIVPRFDKSSEGDLSGYLLALQWAAERDAETHHLAMREMEEADESVN